MSVQYIVQVDWHDPDDDDDCWVVGPYRSEDKARAVADSLNRRIEREAEKCEDDGTLPIVRAFARPLWRKPRNVISELHDRLADWRDDEAEAS